VTKQEIAIKRLTEIYDEAYDRWVHRQYIPDKLVTLIRDGIPDVLALLREQEPRVMTLDEVEVMPYGHVLIETDKMDSLRWLDALLFCKNTNYSFDFITLEGRARLLGTEYNREWRCWTAKPTEKQREETAWNATD